MRALHVIGVNGREASLADWMAGKDMQVLDHGVPGPHVNIRDRELIKYAGWGYVQFFLFSGEISGTWFVDEGK